VSPVTGIASVRDPLYRCHCGVTLLLELTRQLEHGTLLNEQGCPHYDGTGIRKFSTRALSLIRTQA
jgi:hypothetical protein